MYNKPVPQVCLNPVLVTLQSWVMAGTNVHLKAEEKESGEAEDIWPYSSHTDTDWLA